MHLWCKSMCVRLMQSRGHKVHRDFPWQEKSCLPISLCVLACHPVTLGSPCDVVSQHDSLIAKTCYRRRSSFPDSLCGCRY